MRKKEVMMLNDNGNVTIKELSGSISQSTIKNIRDAVINTEDSELLVAGKELMMAFGKEIRIDIADKACMHRRISIL